MWLIISILQWTGLFLVLVLSGLYFWLTYPFDYFKKRGVPYAKGAIPFFGNAYLTSTGKKSHIFDIKEHYDYFKNERFFGHFEFLSPVYYIRDPDLIKQIAIKDFDHFIYHRAKIDEDVEPLLSRNLFLMKSKKWRPMRAAMSPAFTGSKMREIYHQMDEYLLKIIPELSDSYSEGVVELEMKDFYTRLSHDIIAKTAFGIESNSFADRDNEFYLTANKIRNFEGNQAIKFFGFLDFPNIMKWLKIKFYDEETAGFLQSLAKETMAYRESNNISRPDIINQVLKAKKNGFRYHERDVDQKLTEGLKEWDTDDLIGQYHIFLLAGFQVVSQMMCFMSHELVMNPDVQDKLRQEIDDVRHELNGEGITYDRIMQMTYLDLVVTENLRKWPPVPLVDRECTKPYVMEDYAGKKHYLKEGDSVGFPIFAIHNDPALFPNPEKFDPERFSPERIHEIKPYSYFPFGHGPRNCIGNRFALMEAKIILFHFLSTFRIEKSSKTVDPIQFQHAPINFVPVHDFWLQLRVRQEGVACLK